MICVTSELGVTPLLSTRFKVTDVSFRHYNSFQVVCGKEAMYKGQSIPDKALFDLKG